MSREILFKAKSTPKKSGEFDNVWVYGDLIHSGGKYYIHPKGNLVSVTGELGKIIVMHEVIPETICQYTGLTDKNGNKIWENDIVRLFGKDTLGNYNWKAVVEFGNPNSLYSWGYQLKPIGYFAYNTDILCWVGMEEANIYCEVIGNIFDNKGLLKGE